MFVSIFYKRSCDMYSDCDDVFFTAFYCLLIFIYSKCIVAANLEYV